MNPEDKPYLDFDDLNPVDDSGQAPYDLDGFKYGVRLFEKAPRTRLRSDVSLGTYSSSGEYSKVSQFNVSMTGYGRRGSVYDRDDWYGEEETAYNYPNQRSLYGKLGGYIAAANRASNTPDSIIFERLPLISGNYRFVIDRRPAGEEDDYIPAREYTAYFANWQIPIAAPGHRLHPHDVLHSETYARVFGIPEFAEMVSRAAGNALALPDDDGCKEFTNAMDKFGDVLIIGSFSSVEYGMFGYGTYTLGEARTHLQRLVGLYFNTPSEEPLKLGTSETEVFDMLWQKLGFAWKEATYGAKGFSLLRRFVQIERYEPRDSEPHRDILSNSSYELLSSERLQSGYDFSEIRSDAESSHDFENL